MNQNDQEQIVVGGETKVHLERNCSLGRQSLIEILNCLFQNSALIGNVRVTATC